MRKLLFAAVAAASTLFAAASFTAAEELPTVPTAEQTYADIEATFGTVPTHLKAYPKSAIAGAWAMTKGLLAGPDNSLEPKVKSLINLAVAAQIPCRYCIWYETEAARAQGATEAEVAEAIAQAAYVRHWSTVLNGLQVDFETFQSELAVGQ